MGSRAATVTLLLLALVAVACPAGTARLLPTHSFEGSFEAPRFAKSGAPDEGQKLILMTGDVAVEGSARGMFGFSNSRRADISGIDRLEVYDTSGDTSAVNISELQRTGRPIVFAAENVTLYFPLRSSFFLHTNESLYDYTASQRYALIVAFTPPEDLGGNTINLTTDRSLAIIGEESRLRATMGSVNTDSVVYVPRGDFNVTILNRTSGQTTLYSGSRYVYRLLGTPTVNVEAENIMVPFRGAVTANVQPAPAGEWANRFDLGAIDAAIRDLSPNKTEAPRSLIEPDVAKQIQSLNPVLNGVVLTIGDVTGTLSINHRTQDLGKVTLLRFDGLTATAEDGTSFAFEGDGRFLLVGDELYSEKAVLRIGALAIPPFTLVLWLFAAGAIVLSFILKPFFSPSRASVSWIIRLIGWGVHALALLFTLVLWDLEIFDFLGTSLFTLFVQGQLSGTAFLIVLAFEVVPFLLALTYFALPIRFIVNSAFKLGGVKRARGVGKGVGDLAVWGLGAAYIPALLNVVVGALVDALTKAVK